MVVVGGKEGIKKRYNGVCQKEGFIRSTAYRTTFFFNTKKQFPSFQSVAWLEVKNSTAYGNTKVC